MPATRLVVVVTLAELTMDAPEIPVFTRVCAVMVTMPPAFNNVTVPVNAELLTTTLAPTPSNMRTCQAPLNVTPVGN